MEIKIEFKSEEERLDFFKVVSGKPEATAEEIDSFEANLLGNFARTLGTKYLQGFSSGSKHRGEVPLERLKDFRGKAIAGERK